MTQGLSSDRNAEAIEIIRRHRSEWRPDCAVATVLGRIEVEIGALSKDQKASRGTAPDLSLKESLPGSDVRQEIRQDGSGNHGTLARRILRAWHVLVGGD